MQERLNRLSGTLDYSGFGRCNVVIEAVPEKLKLKQQMVSEIEQRAKIPTIFASNTSSLPITDIAKKADFPERVVGMHFFSPVEKMPLVEVIVTEHTAPWVTKTISKLARTMGKHVIVVNDCAGFYTTRILAPYLVEATSMLLEGYSIQDIDRAAEEVGFPVGPITLMDEVGIDVGAKVTAIMKEHYGDRMWFPDDQMVQKFIAEKRLGRKANKGFYLAKNGESVVEDGLKRVDPEAMKHLPPGTPKQGGSRQKLGQRLLLAMLNRAAYCLHEGILRDPYSG